jgi:hypothetical protein
VLDQCVAIDGAIADGDEERESLASQQATAQGAERLVCTAGFNRS